MTQTQTIPIYFTREEIADQLELLQDGAGAVLKDFLYRDSEERERLFKASSNLRQKLHIAEAEHSETRPRRVLVAIDRPDPIHTAASLLGELHRRDAEHIDLRGHEDRPRRAAFLPGAPR